MKTEFLSIDQQRDFPDGCLRISTDDLEEAFGLGMLAEQLHSSGRVHTVIDDTRRFGYVAIRLPLVTDPRADPTSLGGDE